MFNMFFCQFASLLSLVGWLVLPHSYLTATKPAFWLAGVAATGTSLGSDGAKIKRFLEVPKML